MYTGTHKPGNRESETGNQKPGIRNRESETGNQKPGVGNREPNRESKTGTYLSGIMGAGLAADMVHAPRSPKANGDALQVFVWMHSGL